jgi:hypothetical protein
MASKPIKEKIMSTRSCISKLNEDGTITGIYCHFDGYVSGNGDLLHKHYQDEEKVNKLVNLGDISSLNEEVEAPEGVEHSYNRPHKGVTVAYGRDRGETGVEPTVSKDKEDFVKKWKDNWCEYFYQFRESKWYWGKSPSNIDNELTQEDIDKDS